MKISLSVLIFASTVLLFVWCSPASQSAPSSSSAEQSSPTVWSRVCVRDRCRSVEVADEGKEWQQWLMYRPSLPAETGMLFVFDRLGTWQFRMKNTLVPLDMLWLNESGSVVHLEKQLLPCEADPCPTYGPDIDEEARYVLELLSGQVDAYGIQIGDLFRIELE